MSDRHLAARAEDAFNDWLAARLGGRGWTTRILGYAGYGSPRFARVMGRVILSRAGDPNHDWWEDHPEGRRGYWAYFSAPVREVEVTVRVGNALVTAMTDRGGYFDVVVEGHGLDDEWVTAQIATEGARDTTAPIRLIGDDVRFGMVSDIDDTCLVTSLPRPMLAAWNSFVLVETARRAVPGMAGLYRALLAREPDAPVIYLSTGAWNAEPILRRFLRRHGFPVGPLLLTDWGPTDNSWFRSGQGHKRAQLRRLASEFPYISWLLVGDDGQHDPKIYEEFTLEQPDHVAGIAIRKLTATQRVLSHGHPLTHDDVTGRPVQVMVFEGADGYALHRQLRGAFQFAKAAMRRHREGEVTSREVIDAMTLASANRPGGGVDA